MQIQSIGNTNTSFQARNTTIIAGKFLNNGIILDSIMTELNSSIPYQELCSSNKTRTVINTTKPGSTCIASFELLYKPVKKGIMKLFSFLQPYKRLSFCGYGKDYKEACSHLQMEMFNPMVGLFNDEISKIIEKG